MKKFLFLAFAISLMLFCSASHEAFSGASPPASFNYNDKTEISVTGFTTISFENEDNEIVYNYVVSAEEEQAIVLSQYHNQLQLNPESPVVALDNCKATLLSNPVKSYQYAAVTRKIVLTNDFNIYNSTNNLMDKIIKDMQYRSSLWV